MKKAKLLYWIKAVNHYGRHRTFLKEKDAKECEQALKEIAVLIKPKVTEKLVEKWIKKMTETYPASSTDTWLFRKQLTKMLKEIGVEIARK